MRKNRVAATIGQRLDRASLSIARIARLAGVPYAKLIRGESLTEEQLHRVEAVLAKAEVEHAAG